LKPCDCCFTDTKTHGTGRLMRVHVAGKEYLLCISCRAIWGDIRYGFNKKYGTLTKSKIYMEAITKAYEEFKLSRVEKVMLN